MRRAASLLLPVLLLCLPRPTSAQAAPPQEVLYPGLTGQALIDALVRDYKPSTTITGQDAYRDTLYARVEGPPDGIVEDVYTGLTANLPPGEDPSAAMSAQGINVEHTWPTTKGAGEENPLANSDLHHLFPAYEGANTARSNNPFDDIPADETSDWWYRGEGATSPDPDVPLGAYSRSTSTRFQPRAVQRGNTARAMFYFYTMYRPEADAEDPTFLALQRETLRRWHEADPVDGREYDRTFRVAAYQDGLPNPFVLDSTLVRRAYFSGGAEAPFAPGDVAVVGFNASDVRNDAFSFVTLVDLEAGDELFFTDNGVQADGTLRIGEGILRYRAPGPVSAGTAIRRDSTSAAFTRVSSGFTTFALSTEGDQLLAFTVNTFGAARFLYGLNDEGDAWQDDATSPNTSALPPGLTPGQTAVALDEVDNAVYTGPQDPTRDAFLTAVSNPANWRGSADAIEDLPEGPFLTAFGELPVELAYFEARADGDRAVLAWETLAETNNAGFRVEHQAPGHPAPTSWQEVGFVPGAGTTTDVQAYRFAVPSLLPGRHRFRLRQVDLDGAVHAGPEAELLIPLPEAVRLAAPHPNPFRDRTRLVLTVRQPQRVRVEVYDLLGRRVARLFDGEVAAHQPQAFTFDGTALPAGLYVYRVTGEAFSQHGTMTLAR